MVISLNGFGGLGHQLTGFKAPPPAAADLRLTAVHPSAEEVILQINPQSEDITVINYGPLDLTTYDDTPIITGDVAGLVLQN